MPFVYFLVTKSKYNISYIGWTNNLKKRIREHNEGKGAKFTRGRKWKLIYYEVVNNKSSALKREYELKKNRKLRNFIKNIFSKKIINEK